MNHIHHTKGSITIFLCMVFLSLLTLILVLTESSHIHSTKAHLYGISHLSQESALGYFSPFLLEQYGLFAITRSEDDVLSLVQEHINSNLSPSSGLLKTYYNFYNADLIKITPISYRHLTDCNGELFLNQILRYTKYDSVNSISNIILYNSFIENFSKEYIDMSSIDPASQEIDSSLPLSEFSEDTPDNIEISAEDATAKKDSILSKIKEFSVSASLSLYIENTEKISSKKAECTHFPSSFCKYEKNKIPSISISERIMYLAYLSRYFSCYTTKSKQGSALDYQLEYLLHGSASDEENLLASIKKLQHTRTGLNLAYLYTDQLKRTQARTLATAAVGLIPVPFLIEFTQFALLSAWAYGEAILDVRALLKGEIIPVFKSRETWTLDFDNLFVFDSHTCAKPSKSGLNYSQYLILFLYEDFKTEQLYRTMDLIQANIQQTTDSEFLMSDCITELNYQFKYSYKPLFHIQNPFYSNRIFSYTCNLETSY